MHKDIGRYVDYGVNAVTPTNAAAGTSMTNTSGNSTGQTGTLTGAVIDRLALPRMYRSCILSIGIEASLPAAFIASALFKVQDAAASSGPFADYSTSLQLTIGSTSTTALLTLEGGGGTTQNNAQALSGSTGTGGGSDFRLPVDLGAARRYIQAIVVPAISSSSSGYVAVGAKFEFGGADELASTS